MHVRDVTAPTLFGRTISISRSQAVGLRDHVPMTHFGKLVSKCCNQFPMLKCSAK